MAQERAPKATDDDETEEAEPKIPARLRRVVRPPMPNTTFAQRAKARGANKRVDESDSK